MAGEGEFPKVAGDIAYASEANKFQTPLTTSGDMVLLNNQTIRTLNDPASFTKIKESVITNIGSPNSLFAHFTLKSDVADRASTGIVYINGGDVGLGSVVAPSDSYVTGSVLLSHISPGNWVQIYTKYNATNTNVNCGSFQINGSVCPLHTFGGFFPLGS